MTGETEVQPVAWYAQGICKIEFTNQEKGVVQTYIDNHNAKQDKEQVSKFFRLSGPFPLITAMLAATPSPEKAP